MSSRTAHLQRLRAVPLFAGCTNKELAEIARAGDEIVMPAGSTVVAEGQTGREAFVILDGNVAVRRNGRKVATLGEGDVVGELSLLDRGPRTATVVTLTDTTLLVIDQRHFIGVLQEIPSLATKLLAAMAARIRQLDVKYFG